MKRREALQGGIGVLLAGLAGGAAVASAAPKIKPAERDALEQGMIDRKKVEAVENWIEKQDIAKKSALTFGVMGAPQGDIVERPSCFRGDPYGSYADDEYVNSTRDAWHKSRAAQHDATQARLEAAQAFGVEDFS